MGFLRPIAEKQIGSGVRLLLNVFGGWLIKQGIANEAQWDQLALNATPIILAGLWTFYDNWRTRTVIEVAKELPAGATEQDIKKVVKDSTFTENAERALAPKDPV